jgi:hypothetical protein
MIMALSYILALVGVIFACIGIAYQYYLEHRKPAGTRHLPGPWGASSIDPDDNLTLILSICHRIAMDREGT